MASKRKNSIGLFTKVAKRPDKHSTNRELHPSVVPSGVRNQQSDGTQKQLYICERCKLISFDDICKRLEEPDYHYFGRLVWQLGSLPERDMSKCLLCHSFGAVVLTTGSDKHQYELWAIRIRVGGFFYRLFE